MELRATLKEKKRIVIKVGTSTVTYAKTGNINLEKLEKFVRVLINLRNRGKEIIVVSSGAVGIGKNVLGISEKPAGSVKQACAAVGQGRLMMIYEKFFAEYSQLTAQVLLTKESVYSKTCRIHARETFEELLAMNVVPIVNANDAISNVTVISKDFPTFGFDTGLGNIMIDYCMNKYFNQTYDKDGKVADSGKVCESWLECLLQDEYYFKVPPKTTGREYFSPEYIENALRFGPKKPEDIVATATALTAKSIAKAYENFIYPDIDVDEVIVGGGGAYNPTLMKYLRHYLPKHVNLKTHEAYGISNNFKEVMAFALLGSCTYYNIPNNLPSCTGASKRVVLGKLTNC